MTAQELIHETVSIEIEKKFGMLLMSESMSEEIINDVTDLVNNLTDEELSEAKGNTKKERLMSTIKKFSHKEISRKFIDASGITLGRQDEVLDRQHRHALMHQHTMDMQIAASMSMMH